MATFKRLTAKQRTMFISVAESWGEVFEVYSSYGFLVDAGVVQRASQQQVEDYYRKLAADLDRLSGEIKAAVDDRDFKLAASLAKDAEWAQEEINDRREDQHKLAVLSARGRKLASEYVAARDAQLARIEGEVA